LLIEFLTASNAKTQVLDVMQFSLIKILKYFGVTVYNLRYLISSFKFIAFGQFAMSNGTSTFTVVFAKEQN